MNSVHTRTCEEADSMDRAKRRLYACLLAVCLTAVILGIVYYCVDMNQNEIESKGTLVLLEGITRWL